jgi:hypothetical protein
MRGFAKERNMRRDPRVTLLCYDREQPLRYLEIRGTVVEMTRKGRTGTSTSSPRSISAAGALLRRRHRRSLRRDRDPVLCRIRPTRVVALDATGSASGMNALARVPATEAADVAVPPRTSSCSPGRSVAS